MLCYNDEETKLYRMVIYSFPEQRLLGYFPPKSLEYSNFKQYYSNVTSNIVISEYINGDMINLMYDERCHRWHIFSQADNLKTNIIDRFKQAFHINENEYRSVVVVPKQSGSELVNAAPMGEAVLKVQFAPLLPVLVEK